MIRFVLKTTIY